MKLLLGDGGCAVIEFTSLMLKIYTARAKIYSTRAVKLYSTRASRVNTVKSKIDDNFLSHNNHFLD